MSKFTDWMLGAQTRATLPSDPSKAITAPPRLSVEREVSPAAAMSLSSVYRAIGVHAVSGSQLPLGVYRGILPVDPKYVPAFMRKPSLTMTLRRFIEETIVALAARGNAFWRIERDSRQQVNQLTPIDPATVYPAMSRDGSKQIGWWIGAVRYDLTEVQHLKLLSITGQLFGLGPVQAAAAELRGALDTRDYASNWFRDPEQPTGLLKSDQQLNAEQAKAARENWSASQGGRRGVAVLGAGLSYTPVVLDPAAAQFVEQQKFTVTQVARLFGIPASMMLAAVDGTSMTYSNQEQEFIAYVRFSLMEYLSEIEDAFTSLAPGFMTARFDLEGLLRSDTATRYAAYKTARDGKWMSVQEIRDREGLGPKPADLDTDPDTTPTPAPAPAIAPTPGGDQ